MTSNEQLHSDIVGVKKQIEDLLSLVLTVEDHSKRLQLLEQWRKEAEAFQEESRADRQQLRGMVEDIDVKLTTLQNLSTPIIETWEGMQFLNRAVKWGFGMAALFFSVSGGVYFWVEVIR